jgi:hypothetical protein
LGGPGGGGGGGGVAMTESVAGMEAPMPTLVGAGQVESKGSCQRLSLGPFRGHAAENIGLSTCGTEGRSIW